MQDDFKEIVMRQYYAVISNLVAECESLYRLNRPYCELDARIRFLISSAKNDGLDEDIIWEMVRIKLPDYYERTASCPIAA